MTGDEEWLKRHRPRRYWFRILSAERRAAREAAAKAERLAALPQPVRYAKVPGQRLTVMGSLKRGKLPPISASYRSRLFEAQDGRCFLCQRQMASPTEDHVVPKALGGKNRANRLLACGPCNVKKAHRKPYACELLMLQAVNLRVVHRARPWVRGESPNLLTEGDPAFPASKEAAKRAAFKTAMEAAALKRLAREGAPNAYRDSLGA